MSFNVVVPARFASTRLPGKPLIAIAGKPMVIWVVEKAIASGAKQVIVATDDQRIYDVVNQNGYCAVLTKAEHQSGTDRIAEVVEQLKWHDDQIVVNVQGDEPLISPHIIKNVAVQLQLDEQCVMSTACYEIQDKEDFLNPNAVKVVMDHAQRAIYFSRAPIPYPRDLNLDVNNLTIVAHRHIGIYAYRTSFLKRYATLPLAPIEVLESLEQLRVLYAGYKIKVEITASKPETGVDTLADLEKVRQILSLEAAK
jgi:3-deoxy-manno-octulosonate cytidylyltransferase (CMP-KDO synthetase)